MTKRTPGLPAIFLICLALAWPLGAQEQPVPAERIDVSRTAPAVDPDDPIQRWFREQDRLLDDILVRLSRIENLVREIHRLIAQMPAGNLQAAPVIPPPARLPAPPKPAGIFGFFDTWGTELAAIGLLLLVILISRRHRKAKAAKSPEKPRAQRKAGAAPIDPPPAAPAHAPTLAPPNPQGDQALELAEIMLSMGLGHGAAQTLVEQIRSEPKQALRQWLKLLEIYRLNNQQAEFERSAEELRQHFNVQPEDWQAQREMQRSIEDYPHIAMRLTELWNKPGCLLYLQNLLDDNRGGARSGFPQAVAEELLLLSALIKGSGIPG